MDEEYNPPVSVRELVEKREGLRKRTIRITYSESDDEEDGDATPPPPPDQAPRPSKRQTRNLRVSKTQKVSRERMNKGSTSVTPAPRSNKRQIRSVQVIKGRKSLRERKVEVRYSGF